MPPNGHMTFTDDVNYPWTGSLMLCTSCNPLDNEDLTRAPGPSAHRGGVERRRPNGGKFVCLKIS